MKRKLHLIAAWLCVFALLLPLAACGKAEVPDEETEAVIVETEALKDATEEPTRPADGEEETTVPGTEETTAAADESATTADGETAAAAESAAANAVPGTPAEVLAAYTAVMNKGKKDAKQFRKLEYQQLGKDSNFEADWINNPTILEQANRLMTSKEEFMEDERYTKGATNMLEQLPVSNSPQGCLLKDPSALKKATGRQLSNGNIELTLVMKEENNPEPVAPGSTNSPSKTGTIFSPMSKAGIDEMLNGSIVKMAFWGKPPEISTKYFDCKSVLIYDPKTNQIVTLRQDYNVRINILSGKALGIINVVGYATLENVLICDNFRY